MGVSCRNLYSFVVCLCVGGGGSVASVGEEGANLSAVVCLWLCCFCFRGFLFLWVLRMGYVVLLWHSLSLPYNYFPQGNQVVNSLEKMQSVDAILDLSSDPGSEAAYDGGISGNSSCLSSSEIGKQKIPIGPITERQDLLPRSSASEAYQSTQPGNLSSTSTPSPCST